MDLIPNTKPLIFIGAMDPYVLRHIEKDKQLIHYVGHGFIKQEKAVKRLHNIFSAQFSWKIYNQSCIHNDPHSSS